MEKVSPISYIVDTTKSKYARLRPVSVRDVVLTEGFWGTKIKILQEVTIPSQHRKNEETGRLDNFRMAAGKLDTPFRGYYFNDSDVHKWAEAASWAKVSSNDDRDISAFLVEYVALIKDAQEDDGYLDSYFVAERKNKRWENLRDMHELYCAGHFIQAAIAHWRSTGETVLMDSASSLADLICSLFGPDVEGKTPGVPGHPEIEMALVELARSTGQVKYVEQAEYFINARGIGLIGGSPYHLDHKPFRQLETLTGHAVRALYLCIGAVDIYLETGDISLLETVHRLWRQMATRQLYIHGGVGSRHSGEAFGGDYELPNHRAYAETCASIANVMLNWRLLLAEGEAVYADLMELALYNGVLAGWGADGKSYFYTNPLASGPGESLPKRQEWFECACCPPNIARLIASLPGYFYSISDQDEIWVHLYGENRASISLENGLRVELIQRTNYPWSGEIEINLGTNGTYGLHLRIPEWVRTGAQIWVNEKAIEKDINPGKYLYLRRIWEVGDAIRLSLPMPPRYVESHPAVVENTGRVCVMRGPLLYCVEEIDNPGGDLDDVYLFDGIGVNETFYHNNLNGIVLTLDGRMGIPPFFWGEMLYREVDLKASKPTFSKDVYTIKAIPYFFWANRGEGVMRVWLKNGQYFRWNEEQKNE